ncbi:MAG: peptide chain release factor N(5)-glutamine methyltransferase [Bacteroidota bacterium]
MQQTRFYLLKELRRKYPEGESTSLARIILDHTGHPPSSYLKNPDQVPGPVTVAQINEIVSEIHTGKPIQYILGYTYFYDLKIAVNESVLIPRPETEEMVYKIIAHCLRPPAHILDIGTGTGCIALALKNRFKKAVISGLDVSRKALEVAAENGLINRLDVSWIEGDIMREETLIGENLFDLIVSNPPYVLNSERVKMSSSVLNFEPVEALFVEDSDPLIFYRTIASFSMKQLNEKGIVWVEINERWGAETALLFEKAGFQHVTILKDIHEKERFIRAEK